MLPSSIAPRSCKLNSKVKEVVDTGQNNPWKGNILFIRYENIKPKYNCSFHSFSIALFTESIPSTFIKVEQHHKIK